MGKRIRCFAIIVMLLGVIGSCAYLFLSGQRIEANGILYIILCAAGSILAMLPVYWLGCLFDRVEDIQKFLASTDRQ